MFSLTLDENRVTISHLGTSIVNASGRDIASMNYFRHGIMPLEANPDDVNNDRRTVVLPLLLGRFAYDPDSCFPASRRGELTLELDIDVASGGYDDFRFSVETIELLGAKPREYERKTVVSQTFASTGDNDVNLPIGHRVRGLLLFGTTGVAGAAPAPSWGRISVHLDNKEHSIAGMDFETAMVLGSLHGRQPPALDTHTHRVTTDGNAQTELETLAGPIEQGSGGWLNYAFLDFDPSRNDMFALETKGVSDFLIRANAETADAVRVLPVERVSV